jgi:hypothetical protein
VPLNAITAGEFGALLTTLTEPLAVPADAGANCTLKFVDWPAARLTGSDSVPALKPLPATLTWVTVKVPVPLLLKEIVWVAGEPTVTLPKLALDGVMANPGCTALPETGITALAP